MGVASSFRGQFSFGRRPWAGAAAHVTVALRYFLTGYFVRSLSNPFNESYL
ncbi:hypothetical protein MESS2_p90004 [Mesorhizobium metallidurans STM 2683]|uniref:Uncharacterized protein n=1 Tax=Mesorhizobium metallidurans STM 2683 TaxID=1297569 RepID=M5F080_9HYPH|nr:hypothetical protein MESS2_p90004 [Mesorhizobium metallidurans STM 2683]